LGDGDVARRAIDDIAGRVGRLRHVLRRPAHRIDCEAVVFLGGADLDGRSAVRPVREQQACAASVVQVDLYYVAPGRPRNRGNSRDRVATIENRESQITCNISAVVSSGEGRRTRDSYGAGLRIQVIGTN
jgi:hypothetical protein